jgi:hypothetical protein
VAGVAMLTTTNDIELNDFSPNLAVSSGLGPTIGRFYQKEKKTIHSPGSALEP